MSNLKTTVVDSIRTYLMTWFPDEDIKVAEDAPSGSTRFRVMLSRRSRIIEVTEEFFEDLEDPAKLFAERFEGNEVPQKLTYSFGRVVFLTDRIEGRDELPGTSIKSFQVEGFKSYADAEIRLEALTVLIGANASGKSNLLESLRIMSWLAKARRLDELFYSVKQGELSIRGSMRQLFRSDVKRFRLTCRIDKIEGYDTLEIAIGSEEESFRILSERIVASDGKPAVALIDLNSVPPPFSREVAVAYNNFKKGTKPLITCIDNQAIFVQVLTPARFAGQQAQRMVPAVARAFVDAFSRILYLDPIPARMRSPSFIEDKRLHDDGANISSVLYELCKDKAHKASLLEFIKAVPEQEIEDVVFDEPGPRNDIIVKLKESFAGSSFAPDAGILSDGTLRVLAIAAALLTAPQNSLVVIEEIDNGVHPSRARTLLDNMLRTAKERGLSVLVTTHNPALLDNLPKEALPAVTCCYRDPASGSSKLVRLDEIKRYPELLLQGPLGSLMTNGVLDSYLKPQFSDAERKQRYDSWLDGLAVSEPRN